MNFFISPSDKERDTATTTVRFSSLNQSLRNEVNGVVNGNRGQ